MFASDRAGEDIVPVGAIHSDLIVVRVALISISDTYFNKYLN